MWIVFVSALIGGCTLPLTKKPKEEKLVQTYLQKAQEYEEEKNLVEALKQYKLALTVAPDHPEAAAKSREIEIKLRMWAERHYQEGLIYQKRGKYEQARREFLTALRLWPDHPDAAKMLLPRKVDEVKRFVIHTIKAGESLSKLAKMYYGDYHKFPIIAKYNNLPDATTVLVGQKIKVPQIEGLPFLTPKQEIKPKPLVRPSKELIKKEPVKSEEPVAEEPVETPETVDPVANYRELGIELFNEHNYPEAIIELNKVLNVDPYDKAALEYLSRSHFQLGMGLYNKKDYLTAKKEFEASLKYKSDCEKCRQYIKKSEDFYKEIHYRKGVEYFGKEQLAEAIKEWERVQAVDPDYESVQFHLNKARKLLERLREIQKEREE